MTVVLPAPVASFNASLDSGIGVAVRVRKVFKKGFASLGIRSHLSQPNGRFNSLDLAEEWAGVVELVVTPVVKKSCRFGRHLPVTRIRQFPPFIDFSSNPIDDGCDVVLLFLS